MTTSIFLAKVLALYFLTMGLAFLFHQKYFQQCFDDIFENKAMLLFAALIALIIGILLVVAHPIWTQDWRVVITIIGWLAFIKGIMYLFFPKHAKTMKRKVLMFPAVYRVSGIMIILLGLFLGYHGFL